MKLGVVWGSHTHSLFGGLATSLQLFQFLLLLVVLFLQLLLFLHIHLFEGHFNKSKITKSTKNLKAEFKVSFQLCM